MGKKTTLAEWSTRRRAALDHIRFLEAVNLRQAATLEQVQAVEWLIARLHTAAVHALREFERYSYLRRVSPGGGQRQRDLIEEWIALKEYRGAYASQQT